MRSCRQTLIVLAIAIVLGGFWTVALRFLPRPALAETNYTANRLRLENWLLGPPSPSVIVGTSLSGRLLPAYFANTPLSGIANLGLDGASPETGLELVLLREPTPGKVFLEVHLLAKPPGSNDRQLLELATGVGLQVSRFLPLTRADARPSTVLYGWLKELQGRGSAGVSGTKEAAPPARTPTPTGDDWRLRLRPLIRRLQEGGSEVVLIRLPTGIHEPNTAEANDGPVNIARELGLRLIDLRELSRQRGLEVTYTDGLHLTPAAAREISVLLATAAGKTVP